MKLWFTHHAAHNLHRRSGLTFNLVKAYFDAEAAVLSREEKDGVREYVIYSPDDKEHFALVVDKGGNVITFMPIIWRKVAPGFLDEARRLFHEKMERSVA